MPKRPIASATWPVRPDPPAPPFAEPFGLAGKATRGGTEPGVVPATAGPAGAVVVLAGGAVVAAAGRRVVAGARDERGAEVPADVPPGVPLPVEPGPPGCGAGAEPTAAEASRRP